MGNLRVLVHLIYYQRYYYFICNVCGQCNSLGVDDEEEEVVVVQQRIRIGQMQQNCAKGECDEIGKGQNSLTLLCCHGCCCCCSSSRFPCSFSSSRRDKGSACTGATSLHNPNGCWQRREELVGGSERLKMRKTRSNQKTKKDAFKCHLLRVSFISAVLLAPTPCPAIDGTTVGRVLFRANQILFWDTSISGYLLQLRGSSSESGESVQTKCKTRNTRGNKELNVSFN